ncbi:MAG: LacI family transcriptional regulator, partial [Christensenellaceae bacterium]|nr:LacI family transcriptional regulator [Christensenellaceae bacterium]
MRAKDLARLLNVSPATISLVVNNKPGISYEKRNEILNTIYKLNLEHLLKNTDSKQNIGFVIFKRKNKIIEESPFFNHFLEEINDTLVENDYNLKIIYLNTSTSTDTQTETLINSDCVGFVVFAVEMIYSDIKVFQKTDIPFVMLDNYFKDVDVDTVAINNHCGINTAVNYLYEMGH